MFGRLRLILLVATILLFSNDKIKSSSNERDFPEEECVFFEIPTMATDSVLVLAAMLNAECRSCGVEEKTALAHVALKRAKNNFNQYGGLVSQIFAKNQFHGIQGNYFWWDSQDPISLENLRAAITASHSEPKYTCKGCYYFLNPKTASNKKQKQRGLRTKIATPRNFKHIIHQ